MPSRLPAPWAVTGLVAALLGLAVACTEEQRSPWPAGFSVPTTPAGSPAAAAPVGFPAGTPSREQPSATFGFGRPATPAEIEAWDIDVMPDGTGLPPGSGTVAQGASIYASRCATCHGADGKGGPNFPSFLNYPLVGKDPDPRRTFRFGLGEPDTPPRTIGNYWPYATTVYDYINRAMPLYAPGSLKPDEVYSLVAWLLYQNEIIPEHAVMNKETLPQVKMPARDRFVEDNRRGGPEIR